MKYLLILLAILSVGCKNPFTGPDENCVVKERVESRTTSVINDRVVLITIIAPQVTICDGN